MINFKSYSDLSRDIAAGLQKLPKTDLVVGIPRSGVIPAMMIASLLNVPSLDFEAFMFSYAARAGQRRLRNAENRLRVLIVDDSVNTGKAFRAAKARLDTLNGDFAFTTCAIYGLGDGHNSDAADIALYALPKPRLFQWNYRNHIVAEHAIFDMDGVLCKDPTDEENDDGEAYLSFLRNAQPLTLPRKKLSVICTSRLEKYRSQTEDWLDYHDVKYGELIMLDLPSAEERRRLKAHAPFKAEIYKSRSEILFIESNWKQSLEIAKLTDKPVICTQNDAFLRGAPDVQAFAKKKDAFSFDVISAENELRLQIRRLTERLLQSDPSVIFDVVDTGANLNDAWQAEVVTEKALKETRPTKRKRKKPTSQPLHALMISVSFDAKIGGGAAVSSARLRDSLKSSGLDVSTLALSDFEAKQRGHDQPISERKIAFWNQGHDGQHSSALMAKIAEIDPEVVVLGAIDRGIVSPIDIALIDRPIVWISRDNWAHTGGCLFKLDAETISTTPRVNAEYVAPLTCNGYQRGCTNCPAIADPRERMKASLQYDLKRTVYDYRKDIVFAPISEWLSTMMRAAPLTSGHVVSQVYNPISLSDSVPASRPKMELRMRLGLPTENKLVLLGAHNLANVRKGVGPLMAALELRQDLDGIKFVALGDESALDVPEALRDRTQFLGFVSDEETKFKVCQAVDVTLLPTFQESLSVVASDSLCAGTPVVAFETSGLAEILQHQINGFLAKPYDMDVLLDGVLWVLNDSDVDTLASNARERAAELFDAHRNVAKLVELFEKAIEQHKDLGPVPATIKALERTLSLVNFDHEFRDKHIRYMRKQSQEAASFEAALEEMRASTSWRVTQPLRRIKELLGK